MTVEQIKNVVVGSGEGGKYLAWHLAQLGERTAVIERRWIGGSCPNINCLPSKNEIWSAKVAHLILHASQFGAVVSPGSVDMQAVRRRKREMVDALIKMHLDKFRATGAELIMGQARFAGPRTLHVQLNEGGVREIQAERVFLNLGTHASIPATPGLAQARPMTHIEMLELERLPARLIVIGGGYVGLEFAQAYRRFGSQVTVIQHNAQVLAGQDSDVATEVARMLTAEGIEIVTSAEVLSVDGRSGLQVSLKVRTAAGERIIEGTDILVAAGRTPNTTEIGLDLAGVETDARGYLKVNDRLETTVPQVWAIGECAGSPQFTHASMDDYRIIRDNLAGKSRSTRDRVIPSCLFTDPPVAHVGLSEADAKRIGRSVRVARIPTAAVLRTRTIDETFGFLKTLVSQSDDQILGFTMIGPDAGEVMSVVQTAMLAGLPYTALRDAILTHPTMAEGLNTLFGAVK